MFYFHGLEGFYEILQNAFIHQIYVECLSYVTQFSFWGWQQHMENFITKTWVAMKEAKGSEGQA